MANDKNKLVTNYRQTLWYVLQELEQTPMTDREHRKYLYDLAKELESLRTSRGTKGTGRPKGSTKARRIEAAKERQAALSGNPGVAMAREHQKKLSEAKLEKEEAKEPL
jgi:hypothetical protein